MHWLDDSSSKEEYLMNEADIAMILMIHERKKPRHGGSVYGCEYLRRMGVDGHNKLLLSPC